jgi:membrane protease YdiL (CAAX protease family)
VKRDGAALVFAMLFPTVMAWWYFVSLASGGPVTSGGDPFMIAAYTLGKVVQFGFPLAYVWSFERQQLGLAAPSMRGLAWGLAFGALVVAGMIALYLGVLRHSPWLADTPGRVQDKIREFGVETPARFLAFAAFLSVAHSLMEEYYWRWFVFGRLRRYFPLGLALVLSSLAFMSHHVVVLAVLFPKRFWVLALPISLAVAVGGAVFAWLYERTGSLYSPWVAHMLIDAAIMTVGYDMLFGQLASAAFS